MLRQPGHQDSQRRCARRARGGVRLRVLYQPVVRGEPRLHPHRPAQPHPRPVRALPRHPRVPDPRVHAVDAEDPEGTRVCDGLRRQEARRAAERVSVRLRAPGRSAEPGGHRRQGRGLPRRASGRSVLSARRLGPSAPRVGRLRQPPGARGNRAGPLRPGGGDRPQLPPRRAKGPGGPRGVLPEHLPLRPGGRRRAERIGRVRASRRDPAVRNHRPRHAVPRRQDLLLPLRPASTAATAAR